MTAVVCDGYRFILDNATGYYRNNAIRERLHRYLYKREHGADMPSRICVHHIDGNKDNNCVNNLTAMDTSEHRRLHGALMTDEQRQRLRDNMAATARPAACVWHGSEAGKEWHRQHYEEMKTAFHAKHTFVCKHCGKEYSATRGGYCSNACKSAYRRESGADNIAHTCASCGKEFMGSKYNQQVTCSRSCANRMRAGHHEG
jgi:hypothetical protein